MKSIPRDGKPAEDDNPEMIWQRAPGNLPPGIPDEEDIFERPGDVKSIPRDGKPKEDDNPEMIWQVIAKHITKIARCPFLSK